MELQQKKSTPEDPKFLISNTLNSKEKEVPDGRNFGRPLYDQEHILRKRF